MVSPKGDIPEKDDVKPTLAARDDFLKELLHRGETIVHLSDGTSYELHGYDSYVFKNVDGSSVVYTQDEEDAEVWFYTDEIVTLEQH